MLWHPMRGGGGAGQLNVLFCNSWPGGASVTRRRGFPLQLQVLRGKQEEKQKY